MKHTPASHPIPIPSKKQVGISRSHHNGAQQFDDGIPIPITTGGKKKSLRLEKPDRPSHTGLVSRDNP